MLVFVDGEPCPGADTCYLSFPLALGSPFNSALSCCTLTNGNSLDGSIRSLLTLPLRFFCMIPLEIKVRQEVLKHIRNIKDQSLGLFPAEARIRDGFAVHTAADLLTAVFDIALDHEALHEVSDLRRKTHGI